MKLPALRFDDVAMVFERRDHSLFHALDGVSLDIAEGEVVCLVGPSGCGKSTLLKLAAGLATPTSGRVEFYGNLIRRPGRERGMIFQQYALFPWMTAQKNVEYGLKLAGQLNRSDRQQRALEELRLVGLEDFADVLPKHLSGGMKQRVAIARAYAVDPSVILMDEPFGALDAQTRIGLQDSLLESMQVHDQTVLFVTHDVDEAVMLGDRIAVMSSNPGQIAEILPVDEPHPRTKHFRNSERFFATRKALWKRVYGED